MRNFIIGVLIFTVGILKINAQDSNYDEIITSVNFDEDNIFLNDVHCYKYIREGSDFKILDLHLNELITGTITKNSNNEFECEVIFIEVNKKFSNKKMVGRNGIIFGLINNNVIETSCKLNIEKLNKFIEDFNEIN